MTRMDEDVKTRLRHLFFCGFAWEEYEEGKPMPEMSSCFTPIDSLSIGI